MMGIVALVTTINIIFDLNLALGSYGAKSPLPKDWVTVPAFLIIGSFFFLIGLIIESDKVSNFFKQRPWAKWALIPSIVFIIFFLWYFGRYWNYGGKLQWAAENNEHEFIAELVEAGDATQEDLDDAIPRAVRKGYMEATKELIKGGADVNQDEDGGCLIFVAMNWANYDMIKLLIDSGADPKRCKDGNPIEYALQRAGSIGEEEAAKVVMLLIENGADPNMKNEEGKTALDIAINWRLKKLIVILQPLTEPHQTPE